MPARYVDPQKSVGDLPEGQSLSFGFSDLVVETGIPFSRVYDPAAELQRVRQIYRQQAAGSSRGPRAIGFNQNRSLRRG